MGNSERKKSRMMRASHNSASGCLAVSFTSGGLGKAIGRRNRKFFFRYVKLSA